MRKLIAALTVAASLFAAQGAFANNIPVTTTTDVFAADAACSLREAVSSANANADVNDCADGDAGTDTIQLTAANHPLNSITNDDDSNLVGDLDVSAAGPVVFDGQGAGTTTITGTTPNRVLDVLAGSTVTVQELAITGGLLSGVSTGQGGGIQAANSSLTVNSSEIRSNADGKGSGTVAGGGIYIAGGALTVDHSTIRDNFAAYTGATGGLEPRGGGIAADPGTGGTTISITDSTVSGNTVQTSNGTHSNLRGGGIAIENAAAPATIRRSTISGNTVQTGVTRTGGGIRWQNGGGANQTFTLENSTVSDNSAAATGSRGGGLDAIDGDVKIAHVTFAGNDAGSGNSIAYDASDGTSAIRNSVLAEGGAAAQDECGGSSSLTSLDFNIEQGAIDECDFAGANDQIANPGLAALAENGGPTKTRAIGPASPARDNVPAANCLDASGVTLANDQRGVPRPDAIDCDSGAYEYAECEGVAVNLLGTAAGETINGTAGADGILGFGGADTITPGNGADGVCAGDGDDAIQQSPDGVNDTFQGDADSDTVTYSGLGGPADVTIDVGTGTAEGGGVGTDSLKLVENATGSSGNDTLTGNGALNNVFSGLAGNDTLTGGGGDDQLDGGANTAPIAGGDFASFSNSPGGVSANISLNNAAGDGTDTFVPGTIENLVGSPQADNLTGDSGPNLIGGGAGEDDLNGLGGDDGLDGQVGTADEVHFAGAPGAVTATLQDAPAQGSATGFGTDILFGLEEVEGTSFGDTLTGNSGSNVLRGLAGDDILTGNGAADFLFLGADNDTANAQDGVADTIDCTGGGTDTGTFDTTPAETYVGCDTDGDSVVDFFDACPTQAGTLPNGCPAPVIPPGGGTTPVTPTPPSAPAPKKCKKGQKLKKGKCVKKKRKK